MTTDDRYAWWRLLASVLLATLGGIGIWANVIMLTEIQREFAVDRSGASLPYAATMIGFGVGGLLMGRLIDRYGAMWPMVASSIFLASGFVLASQVQSYWQFIAIQSLLIGMLGMAITFGPLVADISHWFLRYRGLAVAAVASGNYLAGSIWPGLINRLVAADGWRFAYLVIGLVCLVTMVPLSFALRRRPDLHASVEPESGVHGRVQSPVAPWLLFGMIALAGLACCVAMSMPQVHIVAYCSDLGYGPARGAEMLSIMLALGVVSRMVSGVIADKIGGLLTLILGSALQMLALIAYLPFDGLVSLYVVSALFGLAQGGIVPSYALVIRQYFPAEEAGFRISAVLTMTIAGMALGGWLSGEIYDMTGSYTAAFVNGIGWNVVNLGIAVWLLSLRRPERKATA